MKNLLYIVLAISLVSCGPTTEDEIRLEKSVNELTLKEKNLKSTISDMDRMHHKHLDAQQREYDMLVSNTENLAAYNKGKKIHYILEFKLKQSRFSLSLSKHAKDAMNAIEFEMPVDKVFYDSHKVGDEVVDDFRMGSMIMNSSFSSWNMTVIGKRKVTD